MVYLVDTSYIYSYVFPLNYAERQITWVSTLQSDPVAPISNTVAEWIT